MSMPPSEELPTQKSVSSFEAKKVFSEACERLSSLLDGHERNKSPRMELLYSLMIALREYTASSNEIPGLGGLGFTEGFELAQAVISAENLSERTVGIHSYKAIALAVALP